MEIACPAKINLVLEVLHRRPDGYHEIGTIYQTVGFGDRLSLEVRRTAGLRLRLTGERRSGVPAGEANLVHQAYAAYQRVFGPAPGLSAALEKKIPPGTGLGGGSSDAGAMLLALRKLCGRPDSAGELMPLAAQLGSDVPFFLHRGTALGTGRGGRLRLLPDAPNHLVLLVLPDRVVSTPEIYRAAGPLLTSRSNRISIHRYLDGKGEVCLHRDIQRNDLESIVFRMFPELGRLKDLLYDTGAWFASLSGSGSGLYGLYAIEEQAAEAAGRFEERSCRTVLTRFLGRGRGEPC